MAAVKRVAYPPASRLGQCASHNISLCLVCICSSLHSALCQGNLRSDCLCHSIGDDLVHSLVGSDVCSNQALNQLDLLLVVALGGGLCVDLDGNISLFLLLLCLNLDGSLCISLGLNCRAGGGGETAAMCVQFGVAVSGSAQQKSPITE